MIQPVTYQFGEFRLDRSARELCRDGIPVSVPTRVFDCLVYLIENRERAIGRDELVAALWGRVDVSDAQLGQIVLRARRAVDDDGNDQRFIRTMPKYGYRWMADTRIVAGSAREMPATQATDAPMSEIEPEATAPQSDAVAILAVDAAPIPRSMDRKQNPRMRLAIAAVVLVIAAIALAWRFHRAAPDAVANASGAAVLPVDVTAGPDQDWVRLGGMDALAARLRAAGLRVPPSESVLAAMQAARGAEAGADANLRAATSAELVVHATLAATPQGWRAELVASPANGVSLRGDAEGSEVLPTLRRAADALLMRMGKVVPDQGDAGNGLDETLQRADAALLANQLDVARKVLLAAPALVRSEPQLKYRLAQIEFRAGRLHDVESALSAVLDDESSAKDPLLRARALTGLGTVHLNLGRFGDSEREFTAAVDALGNWQRPLERGQALAGRGAARAAQWRYADAAEDLGRARIELEQAGDTLGYARIDMVEGELELQRGRPQAARPLLERAIATFDRFDAVNEKLHSLAMLVDCDRLQLDYAAAIAASDKAVELRQRVRDPQLRAQLLVTRADLLLTLGRFAEAGALLVELGRADAPLDPQSLADIARVRAELALATGDAASAASRADEALHGFADPHAAPARAWAARIGERARVALGRTEDARRELYRAIGAESEGDRGAIGYRLALAELAAAENRADDAQREFAGALTAADADGTPAYVVAVVTSYADWALATSRTDAARALVGRVAGWADRDYRCALLQLELFHAVGPAASWSAALERAQKLAGEREIPADLRQPPAA
jgi:DNA-binding winged helix-turn-helix (wHTH) protein/tetratricopeptide (TPR) repeat protein